MRTVAIIPKRSKPEAWALAGELALWLIERGRAVLSEKGSDVEGSHPVPAEELAERSDLIVVLGGDGTLLHAARLCVRREVPILGVNLGTLGFLAEVPRQELFDALERVLAGDYTLERRTRLDVELWRGDERRFSAEVLNDVVIGKNALARIADIQVHVGGLPLTTYNADGVIVSTPTGSTAYSLAAGGPIVHPSVRALLVVPICPHTLTQRPIVLPDEHEVELLLASDSEMFVTLDGQSGQPLECGDRVVVRRARASTVLVRAVPITYYEVLRSKLRWGARW